jgi:hypothetical protein
VGVASSVGVGDGTDVTTGAGEAGGAGRGVRADGPQAASPKEKIGTRTVINIKYFNLYCFTSHPNAL